MFIHLPQAWGSGQCLFSAGKPQRTLLRVSQLYSTPALLPNALHLGPSSKWIGNPRKLTKMPPPLPLDKTVVEVSAFLQDL